MNDTVSIEIPRGSVSLSKDEILSAMGFTQNAPDPIVKTLESILDESLSLLNPRAGWRILPAESLDGSVVVGGIGFQTKKIISSAFKGCDRAAVFTATIGQDLETRAALYSEEGQTLKMYLADVIASEAVEKTADFMQRSLADSLISGGLSITNRYSPGYCGWDVSAQKDLFSLLPDGFCGVRLTPSSMMYPVKTVSGLIGAGAGAAIRPYGCAICDKKDCIRRR
jgi:hypothetical protein